MVQIPWQFTCKKLCNFSVDSKHDWRVITNWLKSNSYSTTCNQVRVQCISEIITILLFPQRWPTYFTRRFLVWEIINGFSAQQPTRLHNRLKANLRLCLRKGCAAKMSWEVVNATKNIVSELSMERKVNNGSSRCFFQFKPITKTSRKENSELHCDMKWAVLFARQSANQSNPHTLESTLRVQMFPYREQSRELIYKKIEL